MLVFSRAMTLTAWPVDDPYRRLRATILFHGADPAGIVAWTRSLPPGIVGIFGKAIDRIGSHSRVREEGWCVQPQDALKSIPRQPAEDERGRRRGVDEDIHPRPERPS